MNKLAPLALVLLLLFSTACKRSHVPTASKKDLKNLAIKPVDFNYLTTRSRVTYKDGDRQLGATAQIRMAKDSLIWISVSPGFGIEAARGLVTQDSLILLNKLQKEYYAYSFAELSNKLGVRVDYTVLQAALLGELIRPLSRRDEIERHPNQVIVKQEHDGIQLANYISNESLRLLKVILQDGSGQNTLQLNYNEFRLQDDRVIPFESTILAQYQQKGRLNSTTVAFKHNKAEFSENAVKFPFSIPSSYARKK
jgi:hypothetical protein